MRLKIIGFSIIIFLIGIPSLSSLAIGQKEDSTSGSPTQEHQPMMEHDATMDKDKDKDKEENSSGQSALDMPSLIDKEYPYERKDEFRQKVASQVDQLDQRIDEIQNQMDEMRDLHSELEKSLIRMEYADESEWNTVRDNVKKTAREVSEIDLIGQN